MPALLDALITEREKAAVRLHVFGNVEDWRLLYIMAGGDQHPDKKRFRDSVSKWKQSQKVKNEIDFQRREKYATDQMLKETLLEEIKRERDNGRETGENEAPRKAKRQEADYTSPAAQKRLLNDLINETNDPGEKLDALKVIISGQRDDRQAAKEGRQVRAYLPINCRECPIYIKEAERKRRRDESAL